MASGKRSFDDFRAGERFEAGAIPVGEEALIRFAQEFDPQPFHTDPNRARDTVLGGLAASGWHTAALTMRLLVDGFFGCESGIVGVGLDELRWSLPVRPGDTLSVGGEILDTRPSGSRPDRGTMRVRVVTRNQRDDVVMSFVTTVIVPRSDRPDK